MCRTNRATGSFPHLQGYDEGPVSATRHLGDVASTGCELRLSRSSETAQIAQLTKRTGCASRGGDLSSICMVLIRTSGARIPSPAAGSPTPRSPACRSEAARMAARAKRGNPGPSGRPPTFIRIPKCQLLVRQAPAGLRRSGGRRRLLPQPSAAGSFSERPPSRFALYWVCSCARPAPAVSPPAPA